MKHVHVYLHVQGFLYVCNHYDKMLKLCSHTIWGNSLGDDWPGHCGGKIIGWSTTSN